MASGSGSGWHAWFLAAVLSSSPSLVNTFLAVLCFVQGGTCLSEAAGPGKGGCDGGNAQESTGALLLHLCLPMPLSGPRYPASAADSPK